MKKRNVSEDWKQKVVDQYGTEPSKIGRAVARELSVPWSTLWDFKQAIINGAVPIGDKNKKPKILCFDIETAPLVVHNWSLFQNYTSLNQIQEDWFMLSWSAKWLGEDEVFYDDIHEHETFKTNPTNDEHIIRSLWKLINEADIIIGHNVKKFDNKKFKARALYHGLTIPDSSRVVDTLEIAKREFSLTSNKLDYLATYLGFENKVSHEGHTLWTKCMAGDESAWATMKEYNVYDSELLEDVYLKVRGWASNHPNVAIYYGDMKSRCPTCGSDDLKLLDSTVKTNLSEFNEFECKCCGKKSRGRVNLLSKEKRSTLLANIVQ